MFSSHKSQLNNSTKSRFHNSTFINKILMNQLIDQDREQRRIHILLYFSLSFMLFLLIMGLTLIFKTHFKKPKIQVNNSAVDIRKQIARSIFYEWDTWIHRKLFSPLKNSSNYS